MLRVSARSKRKRVRVQRHAAKRKLLRFRETALVSFRLFSSRSAYRTNTCTSTALYASVCVDLVLAVALSDSAYRTLTSASTAADALIRNLVCHKNTSVVM